VQKTWHVGPRPMQMGANSMLALVQFVRGRGAVAHQRYSEGFEHLRRTLDPTDPAYLPFVGAWGLSDLVEAAAHTGKNDIARAYLSLSKGPGRAAARTRPRRPRALASGPSPTTQRRRLPGSAGASARR
jgi:hypothetical protein